MSKAGTSFINFVNQTGSPYHTVEACKAILKKAGFVQLRETEEWKLAQGGRYFCTKNNSAICAFIVGRSFMDNLDKGGFVMFGAHTDSPCLRVRPHANQKGAGQLQLGVETYGGGLWHTWFDRGLGVAGKVVVASGNGVKETLVKINRPVCIIPNLAIHLRSAAEKEGSINNEKHLRPILGSYTDADTAAPFDRLSKDILGLICKEANCQPEEVIDVDLCLFDVIPANLCGINEEFVEAARIDNVGSCWAGVQAISTATVNVDDCAVFTAFDHEECGSESWTGANSSCMQTWLGRITDAFSNGNKKSAFERIIRRSILFSADMAHAAHPNYPEKAQDEHRPIMNKGIVIKANSNQRYATHALTAALVRKVAAAASPAVRVQDFMVRNDSPCGTTIGPIISSHIGVRAVDIGCPQWAMHSIRETCGAADLEEYTRFAETAFAHFRSIDADCKYLDDMINEPY